MTTLRLPAVLALTLALAACSGGGDAVSEEHAGPERAGPTESSAGLPKGTVADGEKVATTPGSGGQSCADCHGKDGSTPLDPSYPFLGGQYADYIEHALVAYRDGQREHALMGPQAKDLTDKQIADVASYFASQPTKLTDLSHL
ncbi:MAG: cytochrome c [Xanthomonadaceae bacterium]|nr:cytochrome c [Xanthomonadaceae bacterium]